MKWQGKSINPPLALVASPVYGLVAFAGLIVLIFGSGNSELDRYLVWVGAFCVGVMFSQMLPIWREMTPDQQIRLEALKAVDHPWTPWVNMAKRFSWQTAVLVFLVVCGALVLLVSSRSH